MSAETMVKLSYANIKRNRPSMRHAFQETIEDMSSFEPDRHEFLRRCDVEGILTAPFDSHPTGRTRVSADSQIHRDVLPAEVAGNIDDSQRVWRLHGEAGFFVN